MATWLRQSTAVEIPMGPFVDDADGFTPETALTITQPDIQLKKNGAAWIQKNAAQTLSHEQQGWYEVSLDSTDTNTLGHLVVAIYEAGALPVWREFLVVPQAAYDGVISGSGLGPRVNVEGWNAQAVATPSVAGVPEVDLTHVAGIVTSVSTLATSVQTILTAVDTEIAAILAAVDTEVAAIKAVTDALVIASGRVNANIMAINSDTVSPVVFDRHARAMVRGTVGVGSSLTSIVTSSLDPAAVVTDQFKGRIIIFDRSTTTANLRGQATDITASTAGGVLTVTSLTTAPASGDLFVIS